MGAFVQGAQAVKSGSRVRPTLKGAGGDNQLYQNRLGAFVQGAQAVKAQKYKSSSDGKTYANYNDAKAARDSRLKSLAATQAASRGGSGSGGSGSGGSGSGAPAKVSPTPAKPAAPAPTKPAGPAMGKLGGTTFERRTPTSSELKAAQTARASGASPEKALQAAKSAGAPKVAPSNTLSNTVAAASKPAAFSPTPAVAKTAPTPAAKPTPRQQRLNMEMEYDTFDTVLEHLVSEGYADTNESALVIMANMSEEWRQSILDEGDNYDKNRQRAAKRAAERNAARDRGQTGNVPGVGYVTPRRERETYRDAAGTERHTSGARMPSKDKKDN